MARGFEIRIHILEVGLGSQRKKGHRIATFNSSISSEEMEIAVTESFTHTHTHRNVKDRNFAPFTMPQVLFYSCHL